MTKRSLIVLWLIAAALVAAVYVVRKGQQHEFETSTKRSRGQTLFETFPAEQVAKLTIDSADKAVTLEKAEGGWQVAERSDYPANVTRINELLRTLAEVKVTQGIEAGPSYDPRFGMDPEAKADEDHGYQLTFFDGGGKMIGAVALGKNLESGSAGPFGMGGGTTGRFVRNRSDESGIYVTSETFPRVTAEPKDWLREDFVKVEKIRSIAMAMPNKQDFKPWKLLRDNENADFTLEGAAADESLDTTAVNPLKSIFSFARFEDVAGDDRAKLLDESPDTRTVTIETVEGFNYTIRFAPEPAEDKKDGDDADSAAATQSNYLMDVKVSAEIPAERKKEEGESEEDAKTKDEAFAKRTTELREKLANEQKLEGRVFEVTRWTVDALLKDRDQLVKKAEPAGSAGVATPTPGTTPGRRIEAVTPPIAVPPLPDDEAPGGAADDQAPGRAVDQDKQPAIRPPVEVTTPPIEVPPPAGAGEPAGGGEDAAEEAPPAGDTGAAGDDAGAGDGATGNGQDAQPEGQ